MPAKTLARPVRSGSASSSAASGSKRSSGTTSWIAPSRAPATRTCDSASVRIGRAVSGELPEATSVTEVRKALASAAVRSARPERSSTSRSAVASVPGSVLMGTSMPHALTASGPGHRRVGRSRVEASDAHAWRSRTLTRGGVGRSRVDASATFEGAPERDLVGVLEVAADGQAGRESGDRDADVAQQPAQVGGGGLALEVGVGGDDDLLDLPRGEPGHELADAQVVGADAVDRADRAAEHVVGAAELAGALDGDDVLGLLDDADGGLVAARVGADAAALGLRDVAAHLAEPDARLDLGQRRDETRDVLGVGLEQVEGDALGALGPDAGEPSELVDEVLHRAFVHTATLSPAGVARGHRTADARVGARVPWTGRSARRSARRSHVGPHTRGRAMDEHAGDAGRALDGTPPGTAAATTAAGPATTSAR